MTWIPLLLLVACSSEPPPLPPSAPQGASAAPSTDATSPGAPAPADPAAAPVPADPNVPAEPNVPADPNVPQHVVHLAGGVERTYDEARFACCKFSDFEPVFAAYLQLTAALAAGSQADAQAAVQGLRGALTTVIAHPEVDAPAKAELEKMDGVAGRMDGASIEDMRAHLLELSRTTIIFARARAGGNITLVEAGCAETSTVWLQSSGTIANPYSGPSPAPCGTFR